MTVSTSSWRSNRRLAARGRVQDGAQVRMLRGKDTHGTKRPELGARGMRGSKPAGFSGIGERAARSLDRVSRRRGPRRAAGASLEHRDLLDDVRRVREHSRGNDAGEVVGEVVRRMEAAVGGAVAPALPARGTAGKEAQAPGAAAAYAAKGLYNQRHHFMVALFVPRVVVVAPVEGDVALACLVVKGWEAAPRGGLRRLVMLCPTRSIDSSSASCMMYDVCSIRGLLLPSPTDDTV